MNLVLDTSLIYSEGFASSNLFHFILSSAHFLGHQVHVPAVAIDEATAEIAKELEKDKLQAVRSLRKWERILAMPLGSLLDGLNPQEEADRLRTKLEACDSVLAYPDVPHKELVQWAIQRRKPFDQNGSGYRDSLIWKSVVDLAAIVDSQVVLLACDGDFKGSDDNLAEDLRADLAKRGLEEDKVVLVRSAKGFVDNYIRPQLREVLEGDPTDVLPQLKIDPDETIALWVQDEFSGKEWTGEELGLPWGYETLHLSMVEDVSDLKRLETKEISQDEYLLRIAATLDCEFDALVDKSNAFTLDGFSISNFDWNRHYASGETSLELRCELDINVKFTEGAGPEISMLSMEVVEP